MASIADNFNLRAVAAPLSKHADNFNVGPTPSSTPTGFVVAPLNGGVSVSWDAPATDPDYYVVTATFGLYSRRYKFVSGQTYVRELGRLPNDVLVSVSMVAVNSAGSSGTVTGSATPTAASPSIVNFHPEDVVPLLPAAPTSLVVTASDASAGYAWTTPPDDGGADITGYRLTALAADGTPTTSDVDVVLAATIVLANDVTYTGSVQAINAAGLSDPSPTATFTPTAGLPPVDPPPVVEEPPPPRVPAPVPMVDAFPLLAPFTPRNFLQTTDQTVGG